MRCDCYICILYEPLVELDKFEHVWTSLDKSTQFEQVWTIQNKFEGKFRPIFD